MLNSLWKQTGAGLHERLSQLLQHAQSIWQKTHSAEEDSLDHRFTVKTRSTLVPGAACFYCALNIRAVACRSIYAVLVSEVVSRAQIDVFSKGGFANSP